MNNYSVFVSGRLSKVFEIKADSKEEAMNKGLLFFNEITTKDFQETDVTSEVYIDADELPNEETKDENITEE